MTQYAHIPEKLPGLNDYTRACRANRFQGAKLKAEAEAMIMPYIRQLEPVGKPAMLFFSWHEGNRRRDLDNVAFAKKFILDALVKAGKLKDDDQKHVVELHDFLTVTPGKWGVYVSIEEEG